MKKRFYESKTIQGIVLAFGGMLWGTWTGEAEMSKTIIAVGLTYAGIGFRFAMK